ncbi:MAG: hypothetical protein ABIJ56_17780 [Pseudomonadota bacterium]
MKKSKVLIILTAVALAGVMSLPGCEVCTCNSDGVCDSGEDCSCCSEDCGECDVTCNNNGVCESGENTANCPADCPATGGAAVSFVWYVHGILGGEEGAFGTGSTAEICGMMEATTVQLWIDTDGDSVTDQHFDFTCSAGEGLTTEEWEAGDSLHFAFGLYNSGGTLISQSDAWDTKTLASGANDLGTVNFYAGDYGPLGVELQWADKTDDPAYGNCDFPPDSVTQMGYLLCYEGAACEGDYLYDEVDIDVNPADCAEQLDWDILDFGTYILTIDGDSAGTTVWGYTCEDLVVDSYQPNSNEFICQVVMTTG